MKTHQKFCFSLILLLLGFLTAAAQNRFEGYNIIVEAPEGQRSPAEGCSVNYVAPETQITITDLDKRTPMKVQSCGGDRVAVRQTSQTTATVSASNSDYKWCFVGEDELYRIEFAGNKLMPRVVYNWIPTPDARELGFYNVRDFGARGDGKTDDTIAIRSALAFAATRNGGRVIFPDGDYQIGNTPDYPNFKGLTVTSGVIIEGTGSVNSGASSNNVVKRNAARVVLNGENRAVFRIGECTERVTIRDLELMAASDRSTYGIEAVGAFTSSQDFYFEKLAFTRFARAIYAHALPQNNQQWQFDFVHVADSRFNLSREAAIWIDFWNSDWAIRGIFVTAPAKNAGTPANAIYANKVGMMLIEDTYAGAPPGNLGGDFINFTEPGNITIITSQCENMARSLVFGEAKGAGNLSYNINLIGNIFGNPIEIKGRKNIVSTGNTYHQEMFRLHPDARIYSTGDRFCYDGYIAGCTGAGTPNFIGGKTIFATGQPTEGATKGRPTVFGHDVQFTAPLQVPNVPFADLPKQQTLGNGTFLYCTNCRRGTAPCQAGGSGAPAMLVNGAWSCL